MRSSVSGVMRAIHSPANGWMRLATALVVALSVPLLSFGEVSQTEVQGPGTFDVLQAAQERDRLYHALARDEKSMGPATTLEILPKTADYERFAAARGACATCVRAESLAVGPNLVAGHLVSYKGVSAKAVRPQGSVVARGLLKRGAGASVVWTQRVTSPGASAMRIHLTEFQLAAGFELYLYTRAGEVFGPYRDSGPAGNGDFWSNTTVGDELFLELRSPAAVGDKALRATRFVLADIAHILEAVAFGSGENPKLASCIQDGSCFDTTDLGGIERLRLAVAHMVYAEGGQTFVCTGGLVNDRDDATFLPYFLTANHCINTPEAAASLECIWRFQTASCGAGFTDFPSTDGFPRTLGATLLAHRPESDFAFLQLGEDPPAGSVYLGWTTQRPPGGTTLHRLSHPKGAQQAYSTQTVAADGDALTCGVLPAAQFIYSARAIGSTDGGSSGSPVIWYQDDVLQIAGQLYGSCFDENATDICARQGRRQVDGRFETTYAYIAGWLDPSAELGGNPPNDSFADASQLAGNTSDVTGSNLNATHEAGEPTHAGAGGGKSVWWSWTAEQAGTVFIDTRGSDFNTVLAVYTGTAVNALNAVASNDDDGESVQSRVSVSAASGETYHIAVDGSGGASGAIALHLGFDAAEPPGNDVFANAKAISGPAGSDMGSNLGAGKEAGEPAHAGNAGGHSIWWRWTAAEAGQLAVNTFNSPFDTTLGVYAGDAVNGLTALAANDDTPGTLNSRVTVAVAAGEVYSIAVDGFDGAQGPIALAWSFATAVDNDNFANARTLTGESGQDTGSCIGAGQEDGEPDHGFNSFNSVWWQWQAPSTALYTFETAGSDFDTVLAVYTGAEVGTLTAVGSNDDADGQLTSSLGFSAQADTVYRIAVAGYAGAEGQVQLAWQADAERRFTLSLSANPPDGGTVSATPTAATDSRYAAGTVVTLTAAANTGFTFASWTGTATGTANPDSITMDRDQTRVANFTATSALSDLAQTLLDGFGSADGNGDGLLSISEARALDSGISQALFDALDTDATGLLSRNELERTAGVTGGGCACPPGTATFRAVWTKSLGDLFLVAVSVLTLLVWRAAAKP